MTATDATEPTARLADDTSLECRICWYTYEPSQGDPEQQVQPGTPFSQLPGHWRCPQCDAEPGLFLPVSD